jgi:murein DD-endopeptidase MepM/ murein hydrolase activator NlpD
VRDPLGRTAAALTILTFALAAPAGAHTTDPKQLALAWPADGTITSPFGPDGGRWHPGLDIGILRSLTIRAAASGLVHLTGTPVGFEGYGTLIDVDVGAPYETLYAHLARADVRVGQYVTVGQPIGIAGCTGWCTGTHLHFELRRTGVAVDPSPLLP